MKHMYKSMENYLDECLGPMEDHFRDDYYLAAQQVKNWQQQLLLIDLFIQIDLGNSFSYLEEREDVTV